MPTFASAAIAASRSRTRERQVQNVSRSASYGLGLRVLVNGTWGFAATNLVDPVAARATAEQAVAIAKANALLTTRKVVLANADKVVTTWSNPIKRDPFEVPLETKTAFLMKLNEAAMAVPGVSFINSQLQFVDEQKYLRVERRVPHHAAAGAHVSAVHDHRVGSRLWRLPDAGRRRSRQADGLRIRRGLSVAAGCRDRPATRWSRN